MHDLLQATGCDGAMTGVGALKAPHEVLRPPQLQDGAPPDSAAAAAAAGVRNDKAPAPLQTGCARAAAFTPMPRFASQAQVAVRYLQIARLRGEPSRMASAHMEGDLSLLPPQLRGSAEVRALGGRNGLFAGGFSGRACAICFLLFGVLGGSGSPSAPARRRVQGQSL